MYRSDVISAENAKPGSVVVVCDERGKALGTAMYSSASQIAVRLISAEWLQSRAELFDLLSQRIHHAVAFRRELLARASGTTACRLIYSEADGLPGLIVDRYGDVLSLQVLTQGMDDDDVRESVLDGLLAQPSWEISSVIERVDPRVRELEQLPAASNRLLRGQKTATVYELNGLRFHYDGLSGQKTGAFLDQRENYQAAAQYAHGRALDVFCYQGGFALHLARQCKSVTGVDSSRPALEVAEQNAALNTQLQEVEWMEANAFDLLKDYASAGEKYDTIVLDPPAFAKSRRNLETALRGYKELNLRALKMLSPGGILVTCTCSYHVTESDFQDMLLAAAADAGKRLWVVEKRGQARDHPVLVSVPETAYLKCFICRVVA